MCCLFCDIGELKTKSLLAVNHLQHEAENQGCYTQRGEHHQWSRIVELCRIGYTEGHSEAGTRENEAPKTRIVA